MTVEVRPCLGRWRRVRRYLHMYVTCWFRDIHASPVMSELFMPKKVAKKPNGSCYTVRTPLTMTQPQRTQLSNGWNALTKKMVTKVNAMIALPCLTLSSALLSAAFASTILACCCFSPNRPSSCLHVRSADSSKSCSSACRLSINSSRISAACTASSNCVGCFTAFLVTAGVSALSS